MDERIYGGQRKEKRVTINREFQSTEEFVTEYIQNISQRGAFIRTDEPLPVGTIVDLRFTIIMDELETIEGEGRVVRIVPPGSDKMPGMGVVFTRLTSYSEQLIQKLLSPGRPVRSPTPSKPSR